MPSFTHGTLIATPRGEVAVERLRVGDTVVTRDNGFVPIRWFGKRLINWHDMILRSHLQPILIRQGALGPDMPERDMLVAPNQRMLVSNERTALHFDTDEALVAAKHLVSGNRVMKIDSAGTTYIYFMFARHELVLADGLWTECFCHDDRSLKGLGNAQRTEVLEVFPALHPDVDAPMPQQGTHAHPQRLVH